MIWALYHQGISHQSAIRRGRWVARVRYHAWRTAIPRLAWTNGTMAVPRRGVSRALWHRPPVRAPRVDLRAGGRPDPAARAPDTWRDVRSFQGSASPAAV